MAWKEPDTQSSSAEGVGNAGARGWRECVYDSLPYVYLALFMLLIALTFWPPTNGLLVRLGNLCVIGGTACIASGVILPSQLISHARRVISDESQSPTRYTTRSEVVEIIVEVISELEVKRSLSQAKDEIERRWSTSEVEDAGRAMISSKNIAQAFLRSSKRTYIGSAGIIVGTLLLCAEQFVRIS
ncbi:hypothetical protein ACPEH7_09695 [Stenotrophomonas sp. NPDC101269]|uniref:hypothetical protein n=1 Tax=Stenotrophomonas TaxID=40323 RepID=UPI001291717E|nr:hypothetical protein [Stenotrophomonas nematodicola]